MANASRSAQMAQLAQARQGDEAALAGIIARMMPVVNAAAARAVCPGLEFGICLPENRQPGEGAFVAHSHQGRALGAQCDRAGGDCNGLRGRKQRHDGRENRAITTKKALGNGQPAQTFSTPAFRLDF